MTLIGSERKTRATGARDCRGFTIVELTVSAVLAALIFIVVFSSVSASYSLLGVSRQNLRATQIMVTRLEGLRLEAWSSSTNELAELFNTNFVPTAFTDSYYPLGLNGTTNTGITYYGTFTVTQLTTAAAQAGVFGGTIPSYVTNMALVTVTLNWTNTGTSSSRAGGSHTRQMSTLVAAYGLQNYLYAQ